MSVTDPVPPGVRVTVLVPSDCDGALLVGDIVVVRLTVPAKLPMLFRVIVEEAWEPRCSNRLAGFTDIVKSPVVKTAVRAISGSGFTLPFVMVMQVLLTLVGGVQPVWYPIVVPPVAAVTLYMAVKSRPVVGALVICPGAAITATSIVSMLSWESHTLPLTTTPPIHSRRMEPPGTTVPVMSAPAGLIIV